MKKFAFITLVAISIIAFSCKKDDTTKTGTSGTPQVIPAGMENKAQFTGIYNDTTTIFTKGDLYVSDTTCYLDLYFIHPSSDTLSIYMSSFPLANGTIADGTYKCGMNEQLSNCMAGDWSHGELFADSGTVVVKQTSGIYEIAMELFGMSYGEVMGDASMVGYYKGSLSVQ